MAINNILGSIAFVPRGTYSASATYNFLNFVNQDNHWYLCIVRGGITNLPPAATFVDNTQWAAFVESGDNNLNTITQDTTTGVVTIERKNLADFVFNSGASIYTKDGSVAIVGQSGVIPQRGHLVFNGPSVENKSIMIDGVATDVTQVSTETNENSIASGTSPYTKSTLNDEEVFVFKKLEGTTDEIELADTTGTSGKIVFSAPQIVTNKIGVDSLTGDNGTIRSIKDVSFTPPGDGDVLVYNSTNNRYEPEHHGDGGTLESLSDVNTSNELNGDLLQLLKRTATYYLEPSHIVDGTIFSVKCPGGELITSPAGYPAITQIDFMVNHDESSEARVISLTNGNTHVQIALNYDFTPSINNVITTLYSIFNLSAFSSVFSWGGSLGDRNRNINSHGNYSLVGTYNTMLNPDPAVATTASGSLGFRDARNSVEQSFDVGSVRISINTGISTAVATISLASTTSFATLNSEVLSAINSQTSITDHFTVTNPLNGTMSFTAKATGAQYNGRVELEFFDTGGRGNHSDDISPAFGTGASITGGSGTGATSVLDWTDGSQRSLKNLSFVNCISSFSNGGNTWRNALAPTGGAKTIADAAAYLAETWSAGDLMTPTADFDILSVAGIRAVLKITYDNATVATGDIIVFDRTTMDAFFEVVTDGTPNIGGGAGVWIIGNKTSESGINETNWGQAGGAGVQIWMPGGAYTDRADYVDQQKVILDAIATEEPGTQAPLLNVATVGAFLRRKCTITTDTDGSITFTGTESEAVTLSANDFTDNVTETLRTNGTADTTITFAQDKVYLRLENNGWKEFNFDATIAPGGSI